MILAFKNSKNLVLCVSRLTRLSLLSAHDFKQRPHESSMSDKRCICVNVPLPLVDFSSSVHHDHKKSMEWWMWWCNISTWDLVENVEKSFSDSAHSHHFDDAAAQLLDRSHEDWSHLATGPTPRTFIITHRSHEDWLKSFSNSANSQNLDDATLHNYWTDPMRTTCISCAAALKWSLKNSSTSTFFWLHCRRAQPYFRIPFLELLKQIVHANKDIPAWQSITFDMYG